MRMRPAAPEDAAILSAIHRLAAFIPPVHTAEDTVWFFRQQMSENQTLVAEVVGQVVGYVLFDDDWIIHLFIHPDHQGHGYGAALLDHVMADRRERQLWTFQKNARARKFYEHRGWVEAELTDGSRNEEKEPDVRYVWRP